MWAEDRGTGCANSFCSVFTSLAVSFFSTSTPFPVLAVLFHCGSPFCCPPLPPTPLSLLPPHPHPPVSLLPLQSCLHREVLMTSDYESWGLAVTSQSTQVNKWTFYWQCTHSLGTSVCCSVRIGYITWHCRYQHYPAACFRCAVKSSRTVPENWHLHGAVKQSDPDKDPDPDFNKLLYSFKITWDYFHDHQISLTVIQMLLFSYPFAEYWYRYQLLILKYWLRKRYVCFAQWWDSIVWGKDMDHSIIFPY